MLIHLSFKKKKESVNICTYKIVHWVYPVIQFLLFHLINHIIFLSTMQNLKCSNRQIISIHFNVTNQKFLYLNFLINIVSSLKKIYNVKLNFTNSFCILIISTVIKYNYYFSNMFQLKKKISLKKYYLLKKHKYLIVHVW